MCLRTNLSPGKIWWVEYWKARMRWRESHSYLSGRWWGETVVISMMEGRKTLPRETGKEDRCSAGGSKHGPGLDSERLGFESQLLLFSRVLSSSIYVILVSSSVKWESKPLSQRFVGRLKWDNRHESNKCLVHIKKCCFLSSLPPSFLLPCPHSIKPAPRRQCTGNEIRPHSSSPRSMSPTNWQRFEDF